MNAMIRLGVRGLSRLGLGQVALRITRGNPVILLYHGVTDRLRSGIEDNSGKHVDASLFEEQLRLLSAHRKVVPLDRLVAALLDDGSADNLAAITFDDGYLDNLECAVPILERLGLPASFFLATGYIGTARWMWQDRLESALNSTLHTELFVQDMNKRFSLESDEAKLSALRQLKASLKQLPWREAERAVEQMTMQLQVQQPAPTGIYQFMSWDDVRTMAARGFDVGAHTVNHAILSRIDPQEARGEILDSCRRIETELGRCSRVFAYPNGKETDYNRDVVEFCRENFDAALATQVGAAKGCSLHELARIIVDNHTRPESLAGWVAQAV